MRFTRELPNGVVLTFGTEIFPEYQEVLDQAGEENNPETLDREGIAFYCLGCDDKGNKLTIQLKNTNLETHYGDNVYELGGMYSPPDARGKTPLKAIVKTLNYAIQVFQEPPINSKLLFVTRTYTKTSWDLVLEKGFGFIPHEGFFLTTQPSRLQRAWKKVRYIGDINLLKVPYLTTKQYTLRFGKYYFQDDLIPELNSLRENPYKCLIVGDKDNQATVRLLDKFGSYNSFEIDQVKTYQEDWGFSKAYYTQLIEKLKLYNLNLCKYKNRLNYIDTPDKKYNLIYIDLPNRDYKHLLEQDGIYIDRREYKT